MDRVVVYIKIESICVRMYFKTFISVLLLFLSQATTDAQLLDVSGCTSSASFISCYNETVIAESEFCLNSGQFNAILSCFYSCCDSLDSCNAALYGMEEYCRAVNETNCNSTHFIASCTLNRQEARSLVLIVVAVLSPVLAVILLACCFLVLRSRDDDIGRLNKRYIYYTGITPPFGMMFMHDTAF